MSPAKRGRSVKARPAASGVFERVADLAMNLQWTWDFETQRLFAALDPVQEPANVRHGS